MNEVEIKLSKEQYKTFIKFIYFADYCISAGLVSSFKDSDDREMLSDIITKIYRLGDKLGFPKSISLSSMAPEVCFSEKEAIKYKQMVESDLNNIAQIILAREFAKKDLNLPKRDWLFDHEGGWESKDRLIIEYMQPYLKEFRKNGISNLRFKMFYNLSDEE